MSRASTSLYQGRVLLPCLLAIGLSRCGCFRPASRAWSARSTRPLSLSTTSDAIDATLREKFGFGQLRPLQRKVISRLLEQRSTLAVLATGYGKSLIYQLTALLLPPGLTVVVSPLLALMREQEAYMRSLGLPAIRLDSTNSATEMRMALQSIENGTARIALVSPERFIQRRFTDTLNRCPGGINMLVVDEAHCMSEWGHSFRPDYLRLSVAAKASKVVLALTATATPKVRSDICSRLGISQIFSESEGATGTEEIGVVCGPSRRPNLILCARDAPPKGLKGETDPSLKSFETLTSAFGIPIDGLKERIENLARTLAQRPPGDTIVYVRYRYEADLMAKALNEAAVEMTQSAKDSRLGGDSSVGTVAAIEDQEQTSLSLTPWRAQSFHAGKKPEEREAIQDWFVDKEAQAKAVGQSRILVGTIAYGLGVDKPDVRYVYHMQLPDCIESYAQEVGRAGRDGNPALCEAFVSLSDFPINENAALSSLPKLAAIQTFIDLLVGDSRAVDNVIEWADTQELWQPGEIDVVTLNDGGFDRWISFHNLSLLIDEKDTSLQKALFILEEAHLLHIETPFYALAKVTLTEEGREAAKSFVMGDSVKTPSAAVVAAATDAKNLEGRRAKIAELDIIDLAKQLANLRDQSESSNSVVALEPAVALYAIMDADYRGYFQNVQLFQNRARIRLPEKDTGAKLSKAAISWLREAHCKFDVDLDLDLLDDAGKQMETSHEAGISNKHIRQELAVGIHAYLENFAERDVQRATDCLKLLAGVRTKQSAGERQGVSIADNMEEYFDMPVKSESKMWSKSNRTIEDEDGLLGIVLGENDVELDVSNPPTASGVRDILKQDPSQVLPHPSIMRNCPDELAERLKDAVSSASGIEAAYEQLSDPGVQERWAQVCSFARTERGRLCGIRDPTSLTRFCMGYGSPRVSWGMRKKIPDELEGSSFRFLSGCLVYCKWDEVKEAATAVFGEQKFNEEF